MVVINKKVVQLSQTTVLHGVCKCNISDYGTSFTSRKHKPSFTKMATLTMSRTALGGFSFENCKR